MIVTLASGSLWAQAPAKTPATASTPAKTPAPAAAPAKTPTPTPQAAAAKPATPAAKPTAASAAPAAKPAAAPAKPAPAPAAAAKTPAPAPVKTAPAPVAAAKTPAPKPAEKPKTATAKPEKKPATKEESAEVVAKPASVKEETRVSAANKRDPFVSPIVRATSGPGPICETGKRCLMVDQIVLKGIVKSPNGFIAVVENPMKRAYFLRENDPVFNGAVVKITGDSVVFREATTDKLGKQTTREVVKKVNAPVV